ncbi:uncharacterized protein LOC106662412 [Cimex lectularius]|uniref:RNase H type-1 domain-containing protein n=1 Tax=Cimex lectularius TaxID=79782 RepID=A0A8I6RDT8_CIMLE|nr:uncharacterized protein LOC106662412 [Cimex lectularius]
MFLADSRSLLEGHHLIFTDDSLINDRAGFALYDPMLRVNKKLALPEKCSIFSAESLAVLKALQYVQENIWVQKVAVFTDSKGVISKIERIKANSKCDHITASILMITNNLLTGGINVTLGWIKGHSGIKENEKVDRFAKEAVIDGQRCDYAKTKSDSQCVLNHRWISDWQEFHNSVDGGSLYRSRFPLVPKEPWFRGVRALRHYFAIISRIRSNHGLWGAHMCRIGLKESPNCITCGYPEDLNHIVMECPRFENARGKLLNGIDALTDPDRPYSLETLVASGNKEVYALLFWFLKASNLKI